MNAVARGVNVADCCDMRSESLIPVCARAILCSSILALSPVSLGGPHLCVMQCRIKIESKILEAQVHICECFVELNISKPLIAKAKMKTWILSDWLRPVFDIDDEYTICRDRISAGGFDRPDMQEVSPCQASFSILQIHNAWTPMHIQEFFTLTMDELEKLGIEPMAIRKKLLLAIKSECCR